MTGIKWEAPAEQKLPGRSGRYAAVVEELKKRPGQWAVVAEDAPAATVGYLKRRYGVEATAREVSGSRAARIYARWPEVAA